MQDAARVAFLVTMDAILLALLVALFSGCGGTPAKFRDYRDRNGDFVTNVASAAQTVPTNAATVVGRADGRA